MSFERYGTLIGYRSAEVTRAHAADRIAAPHAGAFLGDSARPAALTACLRARRMRPRPIGAVDLLAAD